MFNKPRAKQAEQAEPAKQAMQAKQAEQARQHKRARQASQEPSKLRKASKPIKPSLASPVSAEVLIREKELVDQREARTMSDFERVLESGVQSTVRSSAEKEGKR